MEPQRAIIVESASLPDGREIQPWTYVWKIGPEQGGLVTIEFRNREYRIPAQCVKDVPIPSPSWEQLCLLDPCFADLKNNLTLVHQNDSSMFTVCQCPHGNYFLEDVRVGVAMYSLWIFLGGVENPTDDDWESLWSKYHFLPPDAVFHLGIGR